MHSFHVVNFFCSLISTVLSTSSLLQSQPPSTGTTPAVLTTIGLNPLSYSNFSIGTGDLPRFTYYACIGSANSTISLLGGVITGDESQEMTIMMDEYGDASVFVDQGQDTLQVDLYGYSQIYTQLDDQLYVVGTLEGDHDSGLIMFDLRNTPTTSTASIVVNASDFDPFNVHNDGNDTANYREYDSVCITATNRDGTSSIRFHKLQILIYVT